MSMQDLDVRDFRRALSQFPTGVTVITTNDEQGVPIGVTASSFNSVSVDPPLILWSIDKGAHSLATFEAAKYFAVNVLSRDQVDTSNRFASRGEDKFKDVVYSEGVGGSPLLSDYSAQFECKTWAVYEGGDHLILVGEVLDYRYQDSNLPLVFARGSYSVSSQHPSTVKYDAEGQTGEFISDYLLYLLRESYNRFSSDLYPKLQIEGGVNPEEWRILAILRDQGEMSLERLAPLTMQPMVTLMRSVEWMQEKSWVELKGNMLALLPEGQLLADRLLLLAKQHETDVLKALSVEQSEQLKDGLRVIMASHR
ncbi:flavin reductase [Amphritea opalescens]|uniref:Flavin reductase n=1 Tax=Amphritea opalescens TaxID=2490544 RepID=A0A430KMZ0_9GAMM|nr:flavin reductase family protein [Amphritea opalescens]RTE64835.1 flavin reductase [Amphritea opalescens]